MEKETSKDQVIDLTFTPLTELKDNIEQRWNQYRDGAITYYEYVSAIHQLILNECASDAYLESKKVYEADNPLPDPEIEVDLEDDEEEEDEDEEGPDPEVIDFLNNHGQGPEDGPKEPHTSDCAIWVEEPCNCIMGVHEL